MKQLLEDYQSRYKNVTHILENLKNTGSENDIKRTERLKTQCSCFRVIIAELEKEKLALKTLEMYETLKEHYNELRKHPEILNNKLYQQYQKIESLLNEINNESN